ncbi:hypothetical protein Leryth_019880 [Lithospermum erythrorhizon]|nr:hypothetical protein Leryth_019880 [Lithospermum erythrorhizon]
MTPTNITSATTSTSTTITTTAKGVGVHSPMPYLFGGLAVMLIIIAIALLILACCYKKSSSQSSSNDVYDEEKPAEKPVYILKPEMEPRIVVIMAGDVKPSYLAKPALVVADCGNDEQV